MKTPPYDVLINDALFVDRATYFRLAADRISKIHSLIRQGRPQSVLDVGFYPGLIGRRIKEQFPSVRLDGLGKRNGGGDFAWYDRIIEAELDPFYGATTMPTLPGRYDLIIACEILEHIINPLPLLRLISTSMNPGGIVLISTPNVSSMGAIARLLSGRSNHELISRSVMVDSSEWRAHIRLYSKQELAELAGMTGLRVIEHAYYTNASMLYERKKRIAWAVRMMASVIPRYREDQMAVLAMADDDHRTGTPPFRSPDPSASP